MPSFWAFDEMPVFTQPLVQNKYQEKDTRRCRPCGLPCAARQWQDAKNSLTLRQVWRLVPPQAALLSGTEWGTARMRIPVQVRDNRMIQKKRQKR